MSAAPDGDGGPRLGAMLGWSALLLLGSLTVAAIALPILHWLGFDPR